MATSPRLRGRGLGAGMASALVAHARETADMVFLAAGDDDVARVYERVGFARLATAAVADRRPAERLTVAGSPLATQGLRRRGQGGRGGRSARPRPRRTRPSGGPR